MPETESAKTWLRAHGFGALADLIDEIEGEWAAAGQKTRRNWWDVLAGTPSGAPRIVAGRRFPILPEARRRQGFALTPELVEAQADDVPIEDAGIPERHGDADAGSHDSAASATESPRAPGAPSHSHTAVPVAPSILDGNTLAYLERQISIGRVVLVTGAGFSLDAKDTSGRPLPLMTQLAQELSELCYPGEPVEDSFGDLFAVAARRCNTEISNLVLRERTAVRSAPRGRGVRKRAAVILVTGTAGSGKSSALMQAAAAVSATGVSVAWIDSSFDRPLADLRGAVASAKFDIVAIDDVDRYGRKAPAVVRDMLASETVQVVMLSVRSSRADAVAALKEDATIALFEYAMPPLDDADIDAILDALDTNHRLGVLMGKTRAEQRQAFRVSAERQLLVAMIEATSGQRFGQKVVGEWEDLPDAQREAYLVVSLASALREPVTQEDVLLCLSNRPAAESYSALQTLLDRRILVRGEGGTESIRARHRIIAETLLDELDAQKTALASACEKLAYAIATRITAGTRRDSRLWRLLTRLISHRFLLRRIGVDAARAVYATLEELLHWDYHFWLQRGSLEVKNGSVQHAELYLNQAYALENGDRLVVTEFAYMLMRKAITSSQSEDAEKWLDEGRRLLLDQIRANKTDEYPYHVLGSQSLGWAAKCAWPKDRRARFLREAKRCVEGGIKLLPKSRDLRQLAEDLEKKIHSVQLGFS